MVPRSKRLRVKTKIVTGVAARRWRSLCGLVLVTGAVPTGIVLTRMHATLQFQLALPCALVLFGAGMLVAWAKGHPSIVEIDRATIYARHSKRLDWKEVWAVHFVHGPSQVGFHLRHDTRPAIVAEMPFFSWTRRQRVHRLLERMLRRANPLADRSQS